MKKLLFIIFVLSLFTACEKEREPQENDDWWKEFYISAEFSHDTVWQDLGISFSTNTRNNGYTLKCYISENGQLSESLAILFPDLVEDTFNLIEYNNESIVSSGPTAIYGLEEGDATLMQFVPMDNSVMKSWFSIEEIASDSSYIIGAFEFHLIRISETWNSSLFPEYDTLHFINGVTRAYNRDKYY